MCDEADKAGAVKARRLCRCGAPLSGKMRFCERCKRLRAVIKGYFQYHGAPEVPREVREAEYEWRVGVAKPGEARCGYCGSSRAVALGYCVQCWIEGKNYVHEVTGRTNGWDRPPHETGRWRKRAGRGGLGEYSLCDSEDAVRLFRR